MDRVSGSKRLRDWVDDSDSGAVTPRSTATHLYDAVDIAAALHIPLLHDDVMLRVVQPTLRGAVKSCGLVPFNTLANTLANVLTDNSSALCFALHQFQIDSCIFGVGLQHEHADSARIFCSLLSVDPWNTLDETSGCQVGNFNQVSACNVLKPLSAICRWYPREQLRVPT